MTEFFVYFITSKFV